jgi:hypothetical protein
MRTVCYVLAFVGLTVALIAVPSSAAQTSTTKRANPANSSQSNATTYASLKTAIDTLLSPPREELKEKAGVKPAEKPEGGAQ